MARILYIVPLIYTNPNAGSMAYVLEERGFALLGTELWGKHQEVVKRFWDSIDRFFSQIEVFNFKIYHDGLSVDGRAAQELVQQGIINRNHNHILIGNLLARGAMLVRTEDNGLIKQEQKYASKIKLSQSSIEIESAVARYRLAQAKLLEQRDKYMARRINGTLKSDDSGILFLSAYHDVISRLDEGINILQLKNIDRVREYQRAVIYKKEELQQLADYLVSAVSKNLR